MWPICRYISVADTYQYPHYLLLVFLVHMPCCLWLVLIVYTCFSYVCLSLLSRLLPSFSHWVFFHCSVPGWLLAIVEYVWTQSLPGHWHLFSSMYARVFARASVFGSDIGDTRILPGLPGEQPDQSLKCFRHAAVFISPGLISLACPAVLFSLRLSHSCKRSVIWADCLD